MFFFFNDTATTEIYTLSLHDALPICGEGRRPERTVARRRVRRQPDPDRARLRGRPLLHAPRRAGPARDRPVLGSVRTRVGDRKSTRLNSSHANISYAVFCLKKKKKKW